MSISKENIKEKKREFTGEEKSYENPKALLSRQYSKSELFYRVFLSYFKIHLDTNTIKKQK